MADKKRISLKALLKLDPKKCEFAELENNVEVAIERLEQEDNLGQSRSRLYDGP